MLIYSFQILTITSIIHSFILIFKSAIPFSLIIWLPAARSSFNTFFYFLTSYFLLFILHLVHVIYIKTCLLKRG